MEPDPPMEPVQYAGQYKILLPIEEGGQGSVYVGSKGNIPYALKVYFQGHSKQIAYQKETQILSSLNFPYIINMVDHHPLARIKVEGSPEYQRPLLVLELAETDLCTFFEAGLVPLSADVCRTYARQLISALRYLDEKGVTHRDIKPENILFDSNFNLKLTDFGLARDAEGEKGDFNLTSRLGSTGYKPPEMEARNYRGLKADIFATGVIIFMMYRGRPPFLGTWPGQSRYELYRCIKNEEYDKFWNLHEKKGAIPLSFKRLMNSFFSCDPEKRPTFNDLSNDEWLNGDTIMDNQLQIYMQEKMTLLTQKKKKLREIASIKVKLYEERVRLERQGGHEARSEDDENILPEERFAVDYLNMDLIKSEDLPQYRQKKAVYLEHSVAFIVAWLKDHLQTLRIQKESIMPNMEEVEFTGFRFGLNEEKRQIELVLLLVVEEEGFELELAGRLHSSEKGKVGIDWVRGEGPEAWFSLVIFSLNSCLQALI